MKKVISIPGAPLPIGPYSQAILNNDMLFISGQVPISPATGMMLEGDIAALTHQVLENIAALLKEANMDFNHIVKTTIFLADMNDFAVVNEVYGSYFESEFPARETVQAARLPKDARVEISAIAMR